MTLAINILLIQLFEKMLRSLTSVAFVTVLVMPALGFLPVFLTGQMAPKESLLTTSYIPPAIQVLVHIIQNLPSTVTKQNIIVNQHEDNGIVILEIIESGEQEQKHNIRSTKKKLKELLTELNKEAEKQNLNKFQGLAAEVLGELTQTSKMKANHQLTFILKRLSSAEVSQSTMLEIKKTIADLENPQSMLYDEIKDMEGISYIT